MIGLTVIDCDLISFNRLGNNIDAYRRGRNRKRRKFGIILSKNSIPWDDIFQESQLKRYYEVSNQIK